MISNSSRRVSVSDMAGDDRRSVEHLLGRPLQEEQQVYVLAFTPGVVPDEPARRAAVQSMGQAFAVAEQHAQRQGVGEEAVDEAVDHVRYRRS